MRANDHTITINLPLALIKFDLTIEKMARMLLGIYLEILGRECIAMRMFVISLFIIFSGCFYRGVYGRRGIEVNILG